MSSTNPSPLDLLEPGVLLGGALAQSLAASVEHAELLPQGMRLGPFRIECQIGAGGMGVVYRAVRDDGAFRQTVAIKSLARRSGERSHELFLHERQILAELRHPHIARLIDGGSLDDGRLWFAMEYVEGARIDHHASERGLDVAARLQLLREVIDAVGFAHARLLVHRDIKPANVLVDGDGRAKLLDFGIATLACDEQAARAYSPAWASPEQLAGALIGPASDQFQLGLLLDVLLAATPVESAATATRTAIGTVAPSERRRSIDPARWLPLPAARRRELAAIARRATADDPAERYGSVIEFGEEIARWLGKRPVSAAGGGLTYALGCAVRRHPLAASAAAVGMLAAIALVTIFNIQLAEARDRALRAAQIAQSVNRFLNEDLLAQADPFIAGRSDLSMREALDRARDGVASQFIGQPAVEANIRATLGTSYSGVGETELGIAELSRAIEIASQSGEVEPDDVLRWRIRRATAASNGGRSDEAFAELDSIDAELAALGRGNSEVGVLAALRRLQFEHANNRLDETLRMADELLARIPRAQPELDALRVQVLLVKGDTAARLARLDLARATLDEALALALYLGGADSGSASRAEQSLAFIDRQEGDFEAAIARQRVVVQRREERFGREHRRTLTALNELASMLQDAKRHPEAEALFREVLRGRLAKDGLHGRSTRTSLNNLGLVLSLQDKLDEAEGYYRQALDAERALLGDDALDVLILSHNLAGLLRKRGQLEAALAMHRDTLERAERTLGAGRAEPALFRVGLAQTLQLLERYAEADREFVAARARLVDVYGADSPRVVRVDQMLEALAKAREATAVQGQD